MAAVDSSADVPRASSFSLIDKDGGARRGIWRAGPASDGEREGIHGVDTPALLLYTRRGLPVHLSPDVMDSMSPRPSALHICALHFLESPSFKLLERGGYGGGVKQFLHLHGYSILVTSRDPLLFSAHSSANTRHGCNFDTPAGRRQVSPEMYMNIISALRPEAFTSFPDEVGVTASEKRTRASTDRTLEWLDKCLLLRREGQATVGVVVGGGIEEERRRSARETAARNVQGFMLGGFGLGEGEEERQWLMNAALELLPEHKPRFIFGLSRPEEILGAVALGIDMFDASSFLHTLALQGFALSFPLTQEQQQQQQRVQAEGSITSDDFLKINLRSIAYRESRDPLLHGCQCYACLHHKRAYIHHLLNAHEMLAEVLLEVHNTHHYLLFFQQIRTAIERRQFDAYMSWFLSAIAARAGAECSQ